MPDCFRLSIGLGIGAAHKPEYGRHLPLSSKRTKVFARGCWLRVFNAVCSEVASKCANRTFCCFWIILHKRITIEQRDLRLFGALDASASALTMRSIAASTRFRTSSLNVRTFSLMIASSGITFSFVPA